MRGKLMNLIQGSIITGFDQNGLGGRFKISHGGFDIESRVYQLNKLVKISELNTTLQGVSSIGSAPLGATPFGGDISEALAEARSKYNEEFLLYFKLGKLMEFFLFELINDTDKQFYFGGLNLKFNPLSPNDQKGTFIIPGDPD